MAKRGCRSLQVRQGTQLSELTAIAPSSHAPEAAEMAVAPGR